MGGDEPSWGVYHCTENEHRANCSGVSKQVFEGSVSVSVEFLPDRVVLQINRPAPKESTIVSINERISFHPVHNPPVGFHFAKGYLRTIQLLDGDRCRVASTDDDASTAMRPSFTDARCEYGDGRMEMKYARKGKPVTDTYAISKDALIGIVSLEVAVETDGRRVVQPMRNSYLSSVDMLKSMRDAAGESESQTDAP